MPKKFLTIDEQLTFLSETRGIIIANEDKIRLMREGYFNVITGYKFPFIIGKDNENHPIFETGTSLKNLLSLKDFDDKLRMLLMEQLVKVEQEIRTIAAYEFDKSNNHGMLTWEEPKAYDLKTNNIKSIFYIISRMNNEIRKNDNGSIEEYLNRHEVVPTWALCQCISFSTFLIFLNYVKPLVRNTMCEIYSTKDDYGSNSYSFLFTSLDFLRKVRNLCAHNEKTYCFKVKNTRFHDRIIKEFNTPFYMTDRDQSVFDCLVYLKYYLDQNEYILFMSSIRNALILLSHSISKNAFINVIHNLGLEQVEDLDKLVEIGMSKNYERI